MDAKQKRVAVSLLTVTAAVLLSLLVAFESNSLVVRLDLVGGFLEIVALAVTWHALGRATRQANDDFNYGFAKLENLCGLLIAQVQLAYLLIFAWMAVQRLLSPVPPAGAGLALLLYAYGTVVTAAMLLWSRRLAKRAPSPVALALYRGYQVKVLANLATGLLLAIAALVPGEGWVRYLDPLNVLLLSAVRLRAIALVMAASGRDLLDAAAEEETRLAVYASLARHFDDYDDLVRLESRRSPQTVFVTLHLAFAEERPLAEVFQTIDRLSQDVRQRVPNAAVAVVPHPLRVNTAA
ncbi:cation diffusion facilitator family transporter [Roseomonas sp. F4]